MTTDERLDRLTERHEALTQSVELLTADIHMLVAQGVRTSADIGKLLEVARLHERRISDVEDGISES